MIKNYSSCPYIRDNNFDILNSDIALDKADPVFEKTIKAKSTRNDLGFITYSNTIYFSGIWLYKCGYILTR